MHDVTLAAANPDEGLTLERPAPFSQQGPYCLLCTIRGDVSHYYSSDESACLLCEGHVWPLCVALGGVAAFFGLLAVGRRHRERVPRRLRALLHSGHSRLLGVYSQLRLRAKVKQCVLFCERRPLEHTYRARAHAQVG